MWRFCNPFLARHWDPEILWTKTFYQSKDVVYNILDQRHLVRRNDDWSHHIQSHPSCFFYRCNFTSLVFFLQMQFHIPRVFFTDAISHPSLFFTDAKTIVCALSRTWHIIASSFNKKRLGHSFKLIPCLKLKYHHFC